MNTKDAKQIKAFKRFLDDAIGKKDTARIFKDVAQQETLITEGRLVGIEKAKIDTAQRKLAREIITTRNRIEPSAFQGRGPEFEFTPTSATGALPKAGVVTGGAEFIGDQKNRLRIEEALSKSAARTTFTALSLGERVASAQASAQKQRELLKTGLTTAQLSKQELVQRQQGRQAQLLRTAFATPLQLRQRARERLRSVSGKAKPKLRFPKPFILLGTKKKKPAFPSTIKEKKAGFNAFVKSKGKNLKINLRPITKSKAFDAGAVIVDRTTSRTFFVKKAGRLAKRPLINIPRNYFLANSKKFRGKIIKGIEQPIKNRPIERTRHAIDTLGEKRQLSAAREVARLKKRARARSKPFKFKRV